MFHFKTIAAAVGLFALTGCSSVVSNLETAANSDFGLSRLDSMLNRVFPDNIEMSFIPEEWLEPAPVDAFAAMNVPRVSDDDAEQARYEARMYANSRRYPAVQEYDATAGTMIAYLPHAGRGVKIADDGIRIAPTTQLDEESLLVQKEQGCIACHDES